MAKTIKETAHEIAPYIIGMREEIHRHPEASFHETKTTKLIASEMEKDGIPYRLLEPAGLIGEIKGAFPGKTVALRADIDALSITEKTDVPFKSENPGLMHACGHDTHTSMLLGAAKILAGMKDQLHGTVRLIFQPGEEIAQGAKAVIKQDGLKDVDMIFGMHIFSIFPAGTLWLREGASMAAADIFKIKVTGKVSHGSMPEAGMDATLAASAIVMNLQSIVSREVSTMKPCVVTVGKLVSGTRFNIVAGEATMEGTCRCFDVELHHALPGMIERIAKETAAAYRCTAEVEYKMMTEVLVSDSDAIKLALGSAKKVAQSPDLIKESPMIMGGEDFADYTPLCKSAFALLGGGGHTPQHSDHFTIDENVLETGAAMYAQFAVDYLTSNL